MGNQISRRDDYENSYLALQGNTFGILDSEGSMEEKAIRLLNLLPVAFEIVDEARDTIARLREENEQLRRDAKLDT